MKERSSGAWYFLGGIAVGAAAGILLAPRRGSETREEIGAWSKRGRERAKSLLARVGSALPSRVKAAAAVGAVKEGTKEAVAAAGDGFREFNES